MLCDGIVDLLLSDPGVLAVLGLRRFPAGSAKDSGIFPALMPQASPLPAIVYQEIFGSGVMTMDGPDPLQFSRVQFDCYARTYRISKLLARAVRLALESAAGPLSDGTSLSDAQRAGEMDTFEETPLCYRTTVDFRIAYADLSPSA